MRRVAASVVAVSALTLISGCALSNPVQTNVAYMPADGVSTDIGQLAIRDLLLVSSGSGAAVLSGSARNAGSETLTVQLTPQGGAAPTGGSELELGPSEQVNLATKGLQLNGVEAKPGSLVTMAVTSSIGGTAVLRVPVLPAAGPYATLTPSAPGPAATPGGAAGITETVAPTATSDASPTATPTTTATTTS